MQNTNKIISISIFFSITAHILFLAVSIFFKIPSPYHIEENTYKLFRVKTVDINRKKFKPIKKWKINAIDFKKPNTALNLEKLMKKEKQDLFFDKAEKDISNLMDKTFVTEKISLPESVEIKKSSLINLDIIKVENDILKDIIKDNRQIMTINTKSSELLETAEPKTTVNSAEDLLSTPEYVVKSNSKLLEKIMAEFFSNKDIFAKNAGLSQDAKNAVKDKAIKENLKNIRKYPPLDNVLTVEFYTYHIRNEELGYFMVKIVPKTGASEFTVMPKDVMFVIDCSKSITQLKLDEFKKGVKKSIENLNKNDRFNIAIFRNNIYKFSKNMMENKPANIKKAKKDLNALIADGETDVYASMSLLVDHKKDLYRPYNILLLSDGRPSVGVTNSREIINKLTQLNGLRTSIYTFGGGSRVNKYFLDFLSYRNKGFTIVVNKTTDIKEGIFSLYNELKNPILLNLRYRLGNIDTTEVFPKILPDFYQNSKVLILGRFPIDTKKFSMQLLGEINGETYEFVFEQDFPEKDTGTYYTARLWAFQKIYNLIDVMLTTGESRKLNKEIKELSKRYNIETPYSLKERRRGQ